MPTALRRRLWSAAVWALLAGCNAEFSHNESEGIPLTGDLVDANTRTLEGGTGHWQVWFSDQIARTTDAAHSGSYGLKVTVTQPYGWGVQMNNSPGFTAAGGPKQISFWARSGTGKTQDVSMAVSWMDSSNNAVVTHRIPLTVGSTWKQGQATVTAPANTKHVWFTLNGVKGVPGDIIHLDDVNIREGGTTVPADAGTPPPVDAGTPPAADAGTPPTSQTCTRPIYSSSANDANYSDGAYYLTNNVWNPVPGGRQTLNVCSHSSWYVTATVPGSTLMSYPNVHIDYNVDWSTNTGGVAIDSLQTISSTFAEVSPHVGIYDVAYDIWVNKVGNVSGATEFMIWNENFGSVPLGSVVATVTLSGRTYQVWRANPGWQYIAFVPTAAFTSGTVNLLEFFQYAQAQGWITGTAKMMQLDYGVEIVSTNGQPANFYFNDFSVTTR